MILNLTVLILNAFFHIDLVSLISFRLILDFLIVQLSHLPLRSVEFIKEPKVIPVDLCDLLGRNISSIHVHVHILIVLLLPNFKSLVLSRELLDQTRNLRDFDLAPCFDLYVYSQRLPVSFFFQFHLSLLFDLFHQYFCVPLLIIFVLLLLV